MNPKFKCHDVVTFNGKNGETVYGMILKITPSICNSYFYYIQGEDGYHYEIREELLRPDPREASKETKNMIKESMKNLITVKYGLKTSGEKIACLIDHVIFHDPATIIYWRDGTKTVVKCKEGETYDKATGFVMALLKHEFGKDFHGILKAWTSDTNPQVIDKSEPKTEIKVTAADIDEAIECVNYVTLNYGRNGEESFRCLVRIKEILLKIESELRGDV